MIYYLIICRSLTYAQKAASLLERAGISAHIQRIPKPIAQSGCGHAVRVAARDLTPALILLRREGLPPRQVFVAQGEGRFEEVAL